MNHTMIIVASVPTIRQVIALQRLKLRDPRIRFPIRNDLDNVKHQLERLDKRVTEDTDFMAKDLLSLKTQIKSLEIRLRKVEMAR